MATIGLDKLYYSKITEDASGNETYATPTVLAKAISAELSVELAEATLYADDVAAEIVKEFKSGTLTLGVDDIGISVAADLTGAQVDKNNVLISGGQDAGSPVAIGFRAKKSMVNINIIGYIELSLEYLQQVLQQKVIQLHSLHHQLKVQYYAEINQMQMENILGKQK